MLEAILERAVLYRKSLGCSDETEAIRIFYGPGETNHTELKHLAIDRYLNHFWITAWKAIPETVVKQVVNALKSNFTDLESVVFMDRSVVATVADSVLVSGSAPAGKFSVKEFGIPYLVQMTKIKHSGLFLDHAELRQWLLKTQNEKTVLNLFSYTGSLSVASGKAGAKKVTTLDLSKPTIEWAKENWNHAGLPLDHGDFIFGDVFEWLPKFKKRSEQFDTILCDPPSFSRSKNGVFSTNKDSSKLHELVFPLLKPGGVLVTSINSENYPESNFLKDIQKAAESCRVSIRVLKRIDLPETFPTGVDLKERYLKGFYLLREE